MLRSPVSGSLEITHGPVTYGAGSWSRVHRQSGRAVASIRSPVWITSFTGPVFTRTGGMGWLWALAHLSAIWSTVVSRASAYTSGEAPRITATTRIRGPL